jgi:hypothetical protein
MPSEHLPSQSQTRPALGGQRSTSSVNPSPTDSPSTTPPPHGKVKQQKHVVGAGRGHARVPSSKALHKLTKAHGNEGSHTDLKKLTRNSSATSLQKNNSKVNLKRNRSSADVPKRPKSSQGQVKRPTSVHFEIGDQDQDETDAGWEEASSSASPALSRAVSSGQSSAKPSASNSQPQSPPEPPSTKNYTATANGSCEKPVARHTADAKVITERLLQRTQSHNTTKMSLATATPTSSSHPPDSPEKDHGSTLNGTPKIGSNNEVVSRFVGGSGTPSENSPFLQNRKLEGQQPKNIIEEVKRAHSMGNLQRRGEDGEDGEESALAPRSRKSSTTNSYVPPQQSRTQQKLWLQRASSNIEPQQMASGVAINGLMGLHGGLSGTSLVGAGYDGKDPRIKLQLERTGLEYLVVRRHQDPVGLAMKRLSHMPGAEKNRRIPPQMSKLNDGTGGANAGRYGLSQSLKENRSRGKGKTLAANGARSSYEGQSGSQDDAGLSDRANEDGVGAILRSMWDKNFDFSASAD